MQNDRFIQELWLMLKKKSCLCSSNHMQLNIRKIRRELVTDCRALHMDVAAKQALNSTPQRLSTDIYNPESQTQQRIYTSAPVPRWAPEISVWASVKNGPNLPFCSWVMILNNDKKTVFAEQMRSGWTMAVVPEEEEEDDLRSLKCYQNGAAFYHPHSSHIDVLSRPAATPAR